MQEGRFREDLYYRLNVFPIYLPALRERKADITLLADYFLERHAQEHGRDVKRISTPAIELMTSYHWPGNVRELENCIERAIALTRFDQVTVEDLPEKIRDYRASHVLVAGDDPTELVSMEEVERRYIQRVLQAVAGNKTLAAQILGFDRKTLYRKLERYNYKTTEK